MKTVYLAAPIDQRPVEGLPARFDYSSAYEELIEAGFTVYDPRSAWSGVNQEVGQASLQRVNDQAIAECDAMLAVLPDSTPSIGVPIEIERAAQLSKPIAVVGAVAATRSPVLAAINCIVFAEVKGAIRWLDGWLDSATENFPSELEPGESGFTLEDVGFMPGPIAEGAVPSWLDRPARVVGLGFVPPVVSTSVLEWSNAVAAEVNRAAKKFPDSDTNTPAQWFSIFIEEALEVAQAWNDRSRNAATTAELKTELIQTAAMAARLWEALK